MKHPYKIEPIDQKPTTICIGEIDFVVKDSDTTTEIYMKNGSTLMIPVSYDDVHADIQKGLNNW